jgi:hypothetical protein
VNIAADIPMLIPRVAVTAAVNVAEWRRLRSASRTFLKILSTTHSVVRNSHAIRPLALEPTRLFRATIALGLHWIERLRGVPFSAPAGRGCVQVLDLDLRVGMYGSHDRFFVLAPHNYVITKTYHGPSLRQ